jgi:DNA primase
MTWENLIEKYGLTLHRVGAQYRGPCPIHRGANPTCFVITPERGWHCFGCGAGGGIEQFMRAMGDSPPPRDEAQPFWRLIVDARLGSTEVAQLHPLDAEHPYFRSRGIHAATARYFGMGFFAGKPPLGGRIIIPLHDPNGALVGHMGRALNDGEPRYWVQQCVRKREVLFHLHRVKQARHDTVVLVEGPFDAAAVFQIGIPNVVASLSCQLSATQRALLSRFRRVVILFDHDDAGAHAVRGLQEELGPAAVPVTLPKMDPCAMKGVLLASILREHGVSAAP